MRKCYEKTKTTKIGSYGSALTSFPWISKSEIWGYPTHKWLNLKQHARQLYHLWHINLILDFGFEKKFESGTDIFFQF